MTAYVCVKDELCVGQTCFARHKNCYSEAFTRRSLASCPQGTSGHCKNEGMFKVKGLVAKIDSDAKWVCKSCHGCQVVGKFQVPEPMKRVKPPTGPWQDIAIDLMGPLHTGESLLVVVDYYSRF